MAPGTLLRDARLKAGLTQAELARRLGTSQSVVARLEAPGANPKLETLRRAVAATGHALQIGLAPASGVDETMIAANLRLAPGQRLARFADAYRSVAGLVGRARNGP